MLPISVPLRRETRATLALAGPIVVAQLAQMATSFVDVIMIGRLGTAAMAAGVLGATVFFTLSLVCVGVLMAVNPSVAQAVGRGDPEEASRATRQGLWLALLLGVPLTVALGWAEPALKALGQAPDTAALAGDYIGAIRWGLVPNLGFAALRGLVEGVSRPRPVLVVALIAVVVNAVANYALMFGAWGFPAMGLEGTGWSSALVFSVMFVLLAAVVRGQRPYRDFRVFAGLRRPDGPTLKTLFKLGWPIGVSFGLEAGLFTTATLMIGALGETALAAHQVAINAASVTFMVPLGIGMAATVRVGQHVGAGSVPAAARAGWVAVALGALFMTGTALLFWLKPDWVVWVYTGTTEGMDGVPQAAAGLLAIAAVFQLFDGVQVTAGGALRGLKDTRFPMIIGAVAYWGIGASTAAVLGLGLGGGAPGVWWGLTLGLAAASVLLSARFRSRTRAGAAALQGRP